MAIPRWLSLNLLTRQPYACIWRIRHNRQGPHRPSKGKVAYSPTKNLILLLISRLEAFAA